MEEGVMKALQQQRDANDQAMRIAMGSR